MAVCLLLFLLCLCFPEISGSGIKNGLMLVAGQVLPAMYPFILLTTLFKHLAAHKPNYHFLQIFIGFLSGYPLGAKVAADYCSVANPFPAQAMLLICNNPSPAYMISFIGLHCLKSPSLGIRMYISIIIGNILAGLFFARCKLTLKWPNRTNISSNVEKASILEASPANSFSPSSGSFLDEVIHDTFMIIVKVSSYILIFSVAAAFIQKLLFLPPVIQGILAGLLEMTTGIQVLTPQTLDLNVKILLMTGLVSFGGLSVMAQTHSMIAGSPLSIKKYITEKAIACTIAVSVMYILL